MSEREPTKEQIEFIGRYGGQCLNCGSKDMIGLNRNLWPSGVFYCKDCGMTDVEAAKQVQPMEVSHGWVW